MESATARATRPNMHIRVLVIDDFPLVREGLSAALKSDPGIDVVGQADNGRTGLELAHELRPDVIITDMRMPVMDGWQFAAELHRRLDGEVPLLVMTAAVDAQQRATEVDADGAISKPFDLDEFVKSVQRLIGPAGRDPHVEVRLRNHDS